MPKPLDMMTASEIQRAYGKVSAEGSILNRAFIDAGRGHERPSEIRHMTDTLAMKHTANMEKFSAIVQEMESRRRYHGGLNRIIRKGY
jgi:hypothetical protein